MSYDFKGRPSDSPYIHMIWQGQVIEDYSPVCPASAHWNLLFAKINDQLQVSVEGATSQFVPKTQTQGNEFLVIRSGDPPDDHMDIKEELLMMAG